MAKRIPQSETGLPGRVRRAYRRRSIDENTELQVRTQTVPKWFATGSAYLAALTNQASFLLDEVATQGSASFARLFAEPKPETKLHLAPNLPPQSAAQQAEQRRASVLRMVRSPDSPPDLRLARFNEFLQSTTNINVIVDELVDRLDDDLETSEFKALCVNTLMAISNVESFLFNLQLSQAGVQAKRKYTDAFYAIAKRRTELAELPVEKTGSYQLTYLESQPTAVRIPALQLLLDCVERKFVPIQNLFTKEQKPILLTWLKEIVLLKTMQLSYHQVLAIRILFKHFGPSGLDFLRLYILVISRQPIQKRSIHCLEQIATLDEAGLKEAIALAFQMLSAYRGQNDDKEFSRIYWKDIPTIIETQLARTPNAKLDTEWQKAKFAAFFGEKWVASDK